MILENWILAIAFLLLLLGVFALRRLWLGALLAIIFVLASKGVLLSGIDFSYIPLLSGLVIAIELALLLFGAYFFYNTLDSRQHFAEFTALTASFSSKLLVLLLLCLFMGSFMEGIAGFGIPAMLIAPMLMALGFKPLSSIVLPLAVNTTAVTFGALGTPLKVGLGIYEPDATVLASLILNGLPALGLPFLLAFLYSKTEQTAIGWKANRGMILGAGVSFALPFFLTGLFSIEYPSVVAGFVGLLLFVSFFVPKQERPPLRFWLRTFYPYFIFVLLLLLAKYFFAAFSWRLAEGARALSLYQPGVVFVLAALVYLLVSDEKQLISQFFKQSKATFSTTAKAMLTILLLVCLAQLLQQDMAALVNTYYATFQQTTKVWVNPLLGVAGSFISGSATMSNLLFGDAIQADANAGTHLPLLLALLHTGSAVGNAISLQNIIMVTSVIHQPSIGYAKILRYNVMAVLLYLLLVVAVAFLCLVIQA